MTDPIARLEIWFPAANTCAPTLSAWSIGAHCEHALLAIRGIAESMATSLPGAEPQKITLVGRVVLAARRIPRGKGVSPTSVLPAPTISTEALQALAAYARAACAQIPELPRQAWWRHHLFGVLHRDLAQRFIRIHTEHHLRIIAEVHR